MDIKDLFKKDYIGKEINISRWIRSNRKQANFGFISLSDGTTIKQLQVVYESSLKDFETIGKYLVGTSIEVTGDIVKSEGNQEFELKANSVKLLGDCDETYPIQPKKHSREFLREQAYLRPRTNLFNAVFRVRSVAAMAIHEYFQNNGYVYFHAPIITASDCEGAGEMFQVTTLDLDRVAKSGKVDYSKDFYGKMAGLTVSGQLEAETFATAFKKTYTFGPTFRAENSNTKVHASEFWMIEPEIAFCDLNGDMDIMEDMLKYIISYVLEHAKDEIKLLKESGQKWEFEPEYGCDIAKEHEKYITEYFNGPVFIKNWPKDIKAFYMKQNDDGETVAAVDLEVPGAGEVMGGSEREESYEKI